MDRVLGLDRPFDLAMTVRMLKAGVIESDGTWWWSTATDHGVGTIQVSVRGQAVRARAWGDGGAALLERLPILVGLDDRVAIEAPDRDIADLLRKTASVRLGATGAVFEALVVTILGQLVTKSESLSARRRIVARFGDRAPGPNEAILTFPRPEVIARLTYEDLHGAGVERKRASTLIEVARRAKRLDEILTMDIHAARTRLMAVRGIGPWTVETVMGVAYGDRDAVPPGDYHLPNTVAYALAGESRGDDDRMFALLEPYRPERRRILVALKAAGVHAPRYGPKSPIRRHL
ncbi:MAG: DNA-3-methyladenine glycosylase 2 family protein [Actinomycetia bacterium]|nr:DNA-3-methyladenine glycosylase 2 family protein [Actinomycetes bacterium]